jgi:hypothetical protein
MSAYTHNDGGLRAYLVQLAGPDEWDEDASDVIAEQRPYVLRFAYDDPPEDPMPEDDPDWEGEDEFCSGCGALLENCQCEGGWIGGEDEYELYDDGTPWAAPGLPGGVMYLPERPKAKDEEDTDDAL